MSQHVISAQRLGELLGGGVLSLPNANRSVELVLSELIAPAELLELAAGRGIGRDDAGGELQFERASFAARRRPAPNVEGVIARCDCGSKLWRVFQLDGATHLHLECGACGVSFCPGGSCE